MFRKFVSAILIAAFATGAQAAQLTGVQGAVFVDHGAGFQPVPGPAVVNPGDRVLTADGSAQIVYDNGCSQDVGKKQAALVLTVPPSCASRSLKDPPAEPGISTGTLLVGGLLIVGGGVGIYVATDPASP